MSFDEIWAEKPWWSFGTTDKEMAKYYFDLGKEHALKLPKELTAENGAKALLIGEFFEETRMECPVCGDFGNNPNCDGCDGEGHIDIKLRVSWTTIKSIYKRIVKHYAL